MTLPKALRRRGELGPRGNTFSFLISSLFGLRIEKEEEFQERRQTFRASLHAHDLIYFVTQIAPGRKKEKPFEQERKGRSGSP